MDEPKRETCSGVMRLACCVFAASVLFEIVSSRCLYADGAHEFIRVLEARNFVALMWSRHFAFYIFEFPLVLAIKMGVTNLAWLRLAFGLGCFLPWPLVLLACYWISRRNLWLAVAGCAAGYLNAAFMAVGEHIITDALFWPSLFVLLFARPLSLSAAVILMACATGLLFSYESQLFLCVPLAVLALWRAWDWKNETYRVSVIVFPAAAALFLAAIGVGLQGILMPELPANFSGFKVGSLRMVTHMGWTLSWTVAWAALTIFAALSERTWLLISSKPGVYVLFALVLILGAWPILAPNHWDNGVQYDNRAMDLLAPMALLPIAWMLRFRPRWIEGRRNRLALLAAALLAAQSLWQISATVHWFQDVTWMRQILASHNGVIPLRSTMLAADGMEGRELHPNAMGGRFDWTWPCLSLALAPRPQIKCIIVSEVFLAPAIRAHYWQPFDPLSPETLPDLRHYGITYGDYIAALNSGPGKVGARSPSPSRWPPSRAAFTAANNSKR